MKVCDICGKQIKNDESLKGDYDFATSILPNDVCIDFEIGLNKFSPNIDVCHVCAEYVVGQMRRIFHETVYKIYKNNHED